MMRYNLLRDFRRKRHNQPPLSKQARSKLLLSFLPFLEAYFGEAGPSKEEPRPGSTSSASQSTQSKERQSYGGFATRGRGNPERQKAKREDRRLRRAFRSSPPSSDNSFPCFHQRKYRSIENYNQGVQPARSGKSEKILEVILEKHVWLWKSVIVLAGISASFHPRRALFPGFSLVSFCIYLRTSSLTSGYHWVDPPVLSGS
ncbi:hypothetical protein Tco_0660032 [Tanacetum coccineum]